MNLKNCSSLLRRGRRQTLAAAVVYALLSVVHTTSLAQNALKRKAVPGPQSLSSGEGRKAFESACAGCHGLDGRGGERGPNIATRQEVLRLSDAETLKILRDGIPAAGMPAFSVLGSGKVSAVLSYLRTLQGKGSAVAIPGDPQHGKVIFYGKARCSECHVMQGSGGFLGADLTAYATNLSVAEIRNAITNSGDDGENRRQAVKVTLRDGEKLVGVVRNEDNFSLQLLSLDGSFHLLQRADVTHIQAQSQPLMPTDYGSTLSAAELDDLVGYLMTVAKREKSPPIKKSKWQDNDH
jgi:cytochrome c oxidase cbb3-type subunit III